MSDELSIKQIELIRSASINTADEFLRMPPATVRCLCDLALRALAPSDAEMPEEPEGFAIPLAGGNHRVVFKFDYDRLRSHVLSLVGRVEELKQALSDKERDRQYHMDAINRLGNFLALAGTSFEVVNAAIDNIKRLVAAVRRMQEENERLLNDLKPPEPPKYCNMEIYLQHQVSTLTYDLARLRASAQREREAALRDAAKVCRAEAAKYSRSGTECAACRGALGYAERAIRALISSPPPSQPTETKGE